MHLPHGFPRSCADSPDRPIARASCGTVAADVTIVAAAGNESQDIKNVEPATYSEVLTATAMTDLDGQPGGLQPPTGECSSFLNQEVGPVVDDKAAFFSNFATVPDGKVTLSPLQGSASVRPTQTTPIM